MVVSFTYRLQLGFTPLYTGYDYPFQRMSGHNSGYTSCFRLHGVPLLPPILTEEERIQCRNYRQQAMDVEKVLEEKRLMKEKQRLEALQEEEDESVYETDAGEDVSASSSIAEVMDFIRKALGDNHDLEEVKFLISQVGEELQKRKSLSSRDSTIHDVDSFSLNQNADSFNLEALDNSLDREKVNESIAEIEDQNELYFNQSECKQAESELSIYNDCVTDKYVPINSCWFEPFENRASKSLTNITSDQLPSKISEESMDEIHKNEIVLDSNLTKASASVSNDSSLITPPKLIRRNSYTLESPSPSVLMYLRSLAGGSSAEKIDISNKVVKNLNNYWDEENTEQDTPIQMSSKWQDDLNQDVVPIENVTSDHRQNGFVTELVRDEYPESLEPQCLDEEKQVLINRHGLTPENQTNIFLLEHTKYFQRAAAIIQAAGRGFLVRRLMKTQKIKDLKVIIKEAVLCAWSLYGEQAVSPADIQLHERIIQQVTAACYELHSIFFNWSPADRMALIRADREKLKNPKPKFRASRNRQSSESESTTSSLRSKSASSASGKSRSSSQRELQRPTTLPSNPRKTIMYRHWSR